MGAIRHRRGVGGPLLKAYYKTPDLRLFHGDCVEVMRAMRESSMDAVVTDPPYFLSFMGREWDTAPRPQDQQLLHEVWAHEALRVLKPGGRLLAFGGTRTYHRLACGIEDAGFEIGDSITWLYGSGFPKSLNVSKSISKLYSHKRRAHGLIPLEGTETMRLFDGLGTALKPAHEPIVMARKPCSASSVTKNVLEHGEWLDNGTTYKHGTGAINIDGCRVAGTVQKGAGSTGFGGDRQDNYEYGLGREYQSSGRWPANLILSHAEDCNGECVGGCPVAELDRQSGGASRFFYVAKASRKERNAGLEGMPKKKPSTYNDETQAGAASRGRLPRLSTPTANNHPTVKPLPLMRYLVRLVTPPGGKILDPFAGSGTTLIAAAEEGFKSIGIEREEEYIEIAAARLAHAVAELEAIA